MTSRVLLLLSLAATDILIGVQALGIFWVVFALVALPLYQAAQAHVSYDGAGLRKSLLWVLTVMLISSLTSGFPKASSLAYAGMFLAYGFWLIGSMKAFNADATAKAMKIIVAAYFCSALAATMISSMGIRDMDTFLFTRQWINVNTMEARPIGFSSEPSYAAFIIVLAWITLVRLGRIQPGARNGFGLWTALTCIALLLFGSIYGYLLSMVVAGTVLNLAPQRTRGRWLAGGVALACVFAITFASYGSDDVRTVRILNAISTGDLETWLLEDTSSFFRFGPLFSYIVSADFGDFKTWLGHGATSASYFFVEMFRLHIDANSDTVELGVMPSYLYDYGLVTGALLLSFLYRATLGPQRPAMVAILILLIFNANFSTQMMWFAVTCALISRHPAHAPRTR